MQAYSCQLCGESKVKKLTLWSRSNQVRIPLYGSKLIDIEWLAGLVHDSIPVCESCVKRALCMHTRIDGPTILELDDPLVSGPNPTPCGSTKALPGTRQKIEIMRTRLENGLSLFNSGDSSHDEILQGPVR